jgi:lactate dehydrogenase-like 2-hydroxyacid dehydrogenase
MDDMTSPSRATILATAPFPSETPLEARFAVHRLSEARDADRLVAEIAGDVRGFANFGKGPVGEAWFDRLPALEIVANFGVGYDQIDAAAAARRGIMVTNTPDVLTDEVADLTLGLLIATLRRIPQADRYVREGGWKKGEFPLSASLRGRRVGIVGLGRIGHAVAERCAAFGLPIAYFSRAAKPGVAWPHFGSVAALAATVDTLIVTAAGGAATKGLVGAREIAALGPNGILVNVARGTVVDEPALIDALAGGRLLAAGLDVFADEPHVPAALAALDNVVLLPHVGSATHVTRRAMGELVVQNLFAWFERGEAITPVAECRHIRRSAGR